MLNVAVRKRLLPANPCAGVEFPVRVKGLGALVREGERRHARYLLTVALRPVAHVALNDRGEIVEA